MEDRVCLGDPGPADLWNMWRAGADAVDVSDATNSLRECRNRVALTAGAVTLRQMLWNSISLQCSDFYPSAAFTV